MSANNFLTSNNFNLPSLSGLGLGGSSSNSGGSSSAYDSGGITGSPMNYSGANENFLYDIGSSLAPSSSNGYNFGLGTGINSLSNSSNQFINNTITSSLNQGILSPLDLSTNTLLNLANGQNATGQPTLNTSASNIGSSINSSLNSLGGDISSVGNSLLQLSGLKTIYQNLTSGNPASSSLTPTGTYNTATPTSESGLFYSPPTTAPGIPAGVITDILIVGGLLVVTIIVIKIIE